MKKNGQYSNINIEGLNCNLHIIDDKRRKRKKEYFSKKETTKSYYII